MGRIVVVEAQPLAHLAGSDSYYRIRVRIVCRRSAKNFDADAALFQFSRISQQRLLHRVSQQRRIAFAVCKQRMGQESLQLLLERRRDRRQTPAGPRPAWIWAPSASDYSLNGSMPDWATARAVKVAQPKIWICWIRRTCNATSQKDQSQRGSRFPLLTPRINPALRGKQGRIDFWITRTAYNTSPPVPMSILH